jgi:hypothetical protein
VGREGTGLNAFLDSFQSQKYVLLPDLIYKAYVCLQVSSEKLKQRTDITASQVALLLLLIGLYMTRKVLQYSRPGCVCS